MLRWKKTCHWTWNNSSMVVIVIVSRMIEFESFCGLICLIKIQHLINFFNLHNCQWLSWMKLKFFLLYHMIFFCFTKFMWRSNQKLLYISIDIRFISFLKPISNQWNILLTNINVCSRFAFLIIFDKLLVWIRNLTKQLIVTLISNRLSFDCKSRNAVCVCKVTILLLVVLILIVYVE